MPDLAIIGGTGLTEFEELEIISREAPDTPWGEISGPIMVGTLARREVAFLHRHGTPSRIPPHRINYRANIWALQVLGFTRIIAIAAVGGIRRDVAPGEVLIPDQIVDYTWGRGHTFFEDRLEAPVHVDFSAPYDADLRGALVRAGEGSAGRPVDGGTYGVTQGPRLESAAEIDRLERDGCDVVGMTGMPEAGLARELDLAYAHIAVVANAAAGRGHGPITMHEIHSNLAAGMDKTRTLIERMVDDYIFAADVSAG